MDRKDFLKCRDDLVRILEGYEAQECQLVEVFAAALNECLADSHFIASVQLHDKVSFTGKTWVSQ